MWAWCLADRPREMCQVDAEVSWSREPESYMWKSVLEAIGIICGQRAVEDIQTAVQTPRCPATGERDI